MATPPTFSAGQVLTSGAMNDVGLWLIETQAIGPTNVSSVLVDSVFSSEFTNYRIIVSGGSSNTPLALGMQMGTSLSGTGYYLGLAGTLYAGGNTPGNVNNGTSWNVAGSAMPDGLALDVTLFEPFLTRKTGFSANSRVDYRTNGGGTVGNGFHNSATSYDGFALLVSGGTFANGTIRVYGYRD
jgi:hypothetical protein